MIGTTKGAHSPSRETLIDLTNPFMTTFAVFLGENKFNPPQKKLQDRSRTRCHPRGLFEASSFEFCGITFEHTRRGIAAHNQTM